MNGKLILIAVSALVCAMSTFLAVMPTQAKPAATFIVDSTIDSADMNPGDGVCATLEGVCSLRAAIQEANMQAGVDEITFSITGTIVLTSALPNIIDNLKIVGPGPALLTISGRHAVRVFIVNSGVNLELSGLTIADGLAPGQAFNRKGGGILNDGGQLTITNSIFRHHTASDGGGGIYSNGGRVFITNSVLVDNNADGGALYNNNGLVTVSNVTVTNNSTVNFNGGGIYTNQGVVTITHSTFSQNHASFDGGALYNFAGTVSIDHSVFVSNTALNYNGGAISMNGISLAIDHTVFSQNRANAGGGGIYVFGGTLNITSSAIFGNSLTGSGGLGGAIYSGNTLNLINSTISANSATDKGGGLYNQGTANIINSTFSGNGAVTLGGDIDHDPPVSSITLTFHNTIVANSVSGGNCSGTLIDGGNNLQYPGVTCGATITNTNPLLGPLQDNGGSTFTHALLAGSPAIDAGSNVGCPATDQRDVARPQDVACDIGAYELQTMIPRVYLPLVLR